CWRAIAALLAHRFDNATDRTNVPRSAFAPEPPSDEVAGQLRIARSVDIIDMQRPGAAGYLLIAAPLVIFNQLAERRLVRLAGEEVDVDELVLAHSGERALGQRRLELGLAANRGERLDPEAVLHDFRQLRLKLRIRRFRMIE